MSKLLKPLKCQFTTHIAYLVCACENRIANIVMSIRNATNFVILIYK